MQITPILLIGAQKSGSSYLFRLIAEHSFVGLAENKEPKIFSKPINDGASFLSFFQINSYHRYLLDGSASYLHVPGTADRAVSQLGNDIPILAVLRDPEERAISGYLHEVKHGRELRFPQMVFDLPDDLESACIDENAKINSAWRKGMLQPHLKPSERYRDPVFSFRYINNSVYYSQLLPWFDLFQNVRLVDFHELKNDPAGVAARVQKWLDLPKLDSIETDRPTNPTRLRFWSALRENRALSHDYRRPSLVSVWRQQQSLFRHLALEKPSIPAGLKASLNREFNKLRLNEAGRWL